MYNSGKVIIGIIIFITAISIPFYYNLSSSATSNYKPSLDTPIINQMQEKQCVKPASYMRAEHMQLLNEWRDSAVRQGVREYGTIDGKHYDKSLQRTCLKCHSNKKEFCDRCHNYAAVKVYCWDCHLDAEGKS